MIGTTTAAAIVLVGRECVERIGTGVGVAPEMDVGETLLATEAEGEDCVDCVPGTTTEEAEFTEGLGDFGDEAGGDVGCLSVVDGERFDVESTTGRLVGGEVRIDLVDVVEESSVELRDVDRDLVGVHWSVRLRSKLMLVSVGRVYGSLAPGV